MTVGSETVSRVLREDVMGEVDEKTALDPTEWLTTGRAARLTR